MNKIKKIAIWSAVIVLAIISVLYIVKTMTAPSVFENISKQSEQVEIAGKRIQKKRSGGKFRGYTKNEFIVSFKFPDGSVKEFLIARLDTKDSKEEVHYSTYDAMNEGDTGILT